MGLREMERGSQRVEEEEDIGERGRERGREGERERERGREGEREREIGRDGTARGAARGWLRDLVAERPCVPVEGMLQLRFLSRCCRCSQSASKYR